MAAETPSMAAWSPVKPSMAAWLATGTFAIIFVLFALSSTGSAIAAAAPLLTYLPILFHLLMLFVVAALPAPAWARMAGFGWLAVDLAVDGMLINGVPFATAWAIRLGSHLPLMMWLVGAAWVSKGPARPLGVLAGLLVGGYTIVAPLVPPTTFMVALVLFLAWLALTARWLQGVETGATAKPFGMLAKG